MADRARIIKNEMADVFAPVAATRTVGRMIASVSQNHGTAGTSGKPGISGASGTSGRILNDTTHLTTAAPQQQVVQDKPRKVDFNIQELK